MISGKKLRILLGVNLGVLVCVLALLFGGRQDRLPQTLAQPVTQVTQSAVRDGDDVHWSPVAAAQEVPAGTEGSNAAPVESQAGGMEPRSMPTIFGKPPGELIPVIFIDPKPEDHFDDDKMSQLLDLRKQFVDALNAPPKPEPNSPEYFARWKELQKLFDSQYRTYFGLDTATKYEALAEDTQPGN